jgi:hypothetical protein
LELSTLIRRDFVSHSDKTPDLKRFPTSDSSPGFLGWVLRFS